jgi:hypothetical protein
MIIVSKWSGSDRGGQRGCGQDTHKHTQIRDRSIHGIAGDFHFHFPFVI